MPALSVVPDAILPVVLPPLLFAATQRATVRQFRDQARPIFLLAVGLTVASAAAAAWVAHGAGLGWGAAWVLGAVVSPPDPVAATAVARRLRLPNRLVTVLEGEGMFNDGTALVLYGAAVAAVVTGRVTAQEVSGRLLLALAAGVAVGLLAGVLTRWALAALHEPTAETTVTVAVPFAVYLLAERVHGSGVLAVLALGLFLRSYGHPAMTSGGWLLGRAVWRYADYLITSLVFVLIGFELTAVLRESRLDRSLLSLTAGVIGTMIALRLLWVFPAAALARLRVSGPNESTPLGSRETLVAGWAGMRGVVTVATALALPLTTDVGAPFPHRNAIVVVGLMTVLVTLVVQGLALVPLVRALQVGRGGEVGREVVSLGSVRPPPPWNPCALRPPPRTCPSRSTAPPSSSTRGIWPRRGRWTNCAAVPSRRPPWRRTTRRPWRTCCARPARWSGASCWRPGAAAMYRPRRPTRPSPTSRHAPSGTCPDRGPGPRVIRGLFGPAVGGYRLWSALRHQAAVPATLPSPTRTTRA
ncbi:MAG TPA: sodium:proton antiporter [Dermatophilaceae bacterium]|nr:sodium:proton antiporter [Dermatophilaceae bacterium]